MIRSACIRRAFQLNAQLFLAKKSTEAHMGSLVQVNPSFLGLVLNRAFKCTHQLEPAHPPDRSTQGIVFVKNMAGNQEMMRSNDSKPKASKHKSIKGTTNSQVCMASISNLNNPWY